MVSDAHYIDIQGILGILAKNPMWPAPANLYIIPDEQGFSMFDVGCGGLSGPEYLLGGLKHWDLDLKDLHTVVLSHAHPDHMGAMDWILEQVRPRVLVHHLDVAAALDPDYLGKNFDIPLAKERWSEAADPGDFLDYDILNYFEQIGCSMGSAAKVDPVHEGDVLGLGAFAFEVIHTPGHSPGHISLFDKKRGLLLSGDVVGKIPAVYTPSSGGVIGYLESLAKLEALEVTIILPAHGPVMEEPLKAIKKIRDRLLAGEAVIIDALGDGPKKFLELDKALFQEPMLRFFPGCGMTESHLIKLERDKIIQRKREEILLIQ